MENFGEYLLGALGCINMILAMRKFEIQGIGPNFGVGLLHECGWT